MGWHTVYMHRVAYYGVAYSIYAQGGLLWGGIYMHRVAYYKGGINT